MNRLVLYEILDFLDWIVPTLKLIEKNNMYTSEREQVFKVAGERIEYLFKQIHRNYKVETPPSNDPGSVSWLKKQFELEDTREEKKEND